MKNHNEVINLISQNRGILFDFNGTLSSDEDVLEISYDRALQDLGETPLRPGEYHALLGRSEPEIGDTLLRARRTEPSEAGTGAETVAEQELERLLDLVGEHYLAECTRSPRISDRTVELILQLDEQMQVGIVTGTLRRLIEPVLNERGLGTLTARLITVEDVNAGKPDPEGFLLGAALLGIPPREILAFEDSPAGRLAAESAGMQVVGIGPDSGAQLAFESMDEVAVALLDDEG